MGLRITTWNVNGIRNPFGYQPWRDKRSFEAMFAILEADIVIMQELKIQRKDLRDDMVLVPGWDCYFSLPKHKKGYSGVAIYTSQAKCSPIRAEEGILGVLCPPNSNLRYCELPDDQHIGGYLSEAQLADVGVDPLSLDAEGRCVVLEFPLFVLFGIYSPANSSGLRDEFRHGFLNALDKRLRNLVAFGKRVIVAGDLNVSRDFMDTAKAEEHMRKEGLTYEDYMAAPNRRMFNQLIEDGIVIGQRDEGRVNPILWDICRAFHPLRKGMFTHWEQKINARPGNFGSRIDFILSSLDMKPWFAESNIQEGLMGSDHCPVYAILADEIILNGKTVCLLDFMNPNGHFQDGKRKLEYSLKNAPPFSTKLLPEFVKRRSIKDMFGKSKVSPPIGQCNQEDSAANPHESKSMIHINNTKEDKTSPSEISAAVYQLSKELLSSNNILSGNKPASKRPGTEKNPSKSFKKAKLGSPTSSASPAEKGQQSLTGFFKSHTPYEFSEAIDKHLKSTDFTTSKVGLPSETHQDDISCPADNTSVSTIPDARKLQSAMTQDTEDKEPLVDPVVSKESWGRLFSKPIGPKCEGHGEPCKLMKTKKPGFNCGREFWICSSFASGFKRPLGPSGAKERNTEWRCPTFIWSSDWNNSNERRST